jgi:hypothetical protein
MRRRKRDESAQQCGGDATGHNSIISSMHSGREPSQID